MKAVTNFSDARNAFETHKKTGHFGAVQTNSLRKFLENEMQDFSAKVMNRRKGVVTRNGVEARIAPSNAPLSEFTQVAFNTDTKGFLQAFGVKTSEMTLAQMSAEFGYSNLGISSFEDMLINYSSNPHSRGGIDESYRFIIPEVFLDVIRTQLQHTSQHTNWVGSTVSVNDRKVTAPRIERGDAFPRRVAEGAKIPLGTLKFGKKEITIYKIGIGIKFTDELLISSTFDLLAEFLTAVGNDIAIGEDQEALHVLINGDQDDGSESAPSFGINSATAGQIRQTDMVKMLNRATRLKHPITRILTTEEILSKDLNDGMPNRPFTTLDDYKTNIPKEAVTMPANKLLGLANAPLTKLQFRGLTTERDRDSQSQTESLFISNHVGFVITERNRRLLMDLNTQFVANTATDFPSWANPDTVLAETFNS